MFTDKKIICVIILIFFTTSISFAENRKTAISSGSRVRIRTTPNLSGEILGYLEKGELFEIIERSPQKNKINKHENYWYKILTSKSVKGWIFGQFVQTIKIIYNTKIREDSIEYYEFKELIQECGIFDDKRIVKSGISLEEKKSTINNIEIVLKADRIYFDCDGNIIAGHLKNDTELITGNYKFKFSAGSYIKFDHRFDRSGKINIGILSKNSLFKIGSKDITFKGGSKIYFDHKGNISGGHLLNDEIFFIAGKKVKFESGTYVSFHSNEMLHWAILPENTEFILGKEKILFSENTKIQFYETGEVWSGVLAEDTKIVTHESDEYPEKSLWNKGDRVTFTKNGDAFYTDI